MQSDIEKISHLAHNRRLLSQSASSGAMRAELAKMAGEFDAKIERYKLDQSARAKRQA